VTSLDNAWSPVGAQISSTRGHRHTASRLYIFSQSLRSSFPGFRHRYTRRPRDWSPHSFSFVLEHSFRSFEVARDSHQDVKRSMYVTFVASTSRITDDDWLAMAWYSTLPYGLQSAGPGRTQNLGGPYAEVAPGRRGEIQTNKPIPQSTETLVAIQRSLDETPPGLCARGKST
jgi:hypothetical protein